jgi:basic membrane protein A
MGAESGSTAQGGISRRRFLQRAGSVSVVGIAGGILAPELLAACGSSKPAASSSATAKSSSSTTSSSAPKSVALLSPQKSGGDPPVLDMIAAMDKVATAHNLKKRYVFVGDPAKYTSTLDLLAKSYDIVATAFPEMGAPVKAAAEANPKTRFIWIFGTPFDPPISNVVTVGYKFYKGMYFAGILAASVSSTNKIGYIGGAASPELNSDFHAYKAGAQSVKPSISVSGAYAGSFTDPNGGLQIADSMYGSGIDVIQTDASATDAGVLEAAKAHKLYMSYDSDPTAYKQAPGLILGSAILEFGTSLELELEEALKPTWSAGGTSVEQGLKDKVTGYVASPDFAKDAPSAVGKRFSAGLAKVQEAEKKAIAGTLSIPFDTKSIS